MPRRIFDDPRAWLPRQVAAETLDALGGQGLTSHAGTCPHCDCRHLVVHLCEPDVSHNAWTGYECVRCAAVHTLADHNPALWKWLMSTLSQVAH